MKPKNRRKFQIVRWVNWASCMLTYRTGLNLNQIIILSIIIDPFVRRRWPTGFDFAIFIALLRISCDRMPECYQSLASYRPHTFANHRKGFESKLEIIIWVFFNFSALFGRLRSTNIGVLFVAAVGC